MGVLLIKYGLIWRAIISCLGAFLVAVLIFQPISLRAATFNVGCSVTELINAVNAANNNGEPDTLNLTAGCTYTLTNPRGDMVVTNGSTGLPSINGEITIQGNDAIIERSSDPFTMPFRIFHVSANGALYLNNLTIRNGYLKAFNGTPTADGGTGIDGLDGANGNGPQNPGMPGELGGLAAA